MSALRTAREDLEDVMINARSTGPTDEPGSMPLSSWNSGHSSRPVTLRPARATAQPGPRRAYLAPRDDCYSPARILVRLVYAGAAIGAVLSVYLRLQSYLGGSVTALVPAIFVAVTAIGMLAQNRGRSRREP